MGDIVTTPAEARDWAVTLHDRLGLIALPCWGGGKALSGRDHKALADSPPDRGAIAHADYNGGLAILGGAQHRDGGFVLGLDVDHGPLVWPAMPKGGLLVEAGTAPNKWHCWTRATDRLEGQANLRDSAGTLVAELKGRGHALRAWPTLPEGKPGGYAPFLAVPDPKKEIVALTATQLAEGLADYLGRVLQTEVAVEHHLQSPHQGLAPGPAPAWLSLVYEAILNHLEGLGRPLRTTRDGSLVAWCPFHQGRSASLSVHPTRGWKCWAGCGHGRPTLLAARLGLRVPQEVIRDEIVQ